MRVEKNSELESLFVDALYKKYNNGSRCGTHVSDLLFCLRESYFRKVDPKPHSLRTLGFFVDGARRHEVLQELLDVKAEVPVSKHGVRGTVDMVVKGFSKAPVEIKTTRSKYNISEHYLTQLGFYACMIGVKEGYLIIQRILGDVPWEFYHVEWSESEIGDLDESMRFKSILLRQALDYRDPSRLPRVNNGMEWKCRFCDYREECAKLR